VAEKKLDLVQFSASQVACHDEANRNRRDRRGSVRTGDECVPLGCRTRAHCVRAGTGRPAWRERWDSLTLLSPNWFTRLPKYSYSGDDPNGFIGRDEIVQFFADYAPLLKTPIECGFDVTRVHPTDGSNRIIVRGADGTSFDADNVVVAIGGYHRPKVPPVSKLLPRTVVQVHSNHYRNPGQLPQARSWWSERAPRVSRSLKN
jgi:hypothetical protein